MYYPMQTPKRNMIDENMNLEEPPRDEKIIVSNEDHLEELIEEVLIKTCRRVNTAEIKLDCSPLYAARLPDNCT